MRTRAYNKMRNLKITAGVSKFAYGSSFTQLGDTQIHCTASVRGGVPSFVNDRQPSQGWLTAEYSMLPGATPQRTRRERPQASGRSQEIQRLIGRSLRGIVDLSKCPDLSIAIDCDVVQADGSTRTASIIGAYVALRMCANKLIKEGRAIRDPIIHRIGALSIGLKENNLLCDLDYQEDADIDLDMNVVMVEDGGILEIQGTAEKKVFTKEQLVQIVDLANSNMAYIISCQDEALRNLSS